MYSELTTTSKTPELISIGCPHLNFAEIKDILSKIQGKKFSIPVWISTAREFKEKIESDWSIDNLRASNIFIYSDCCVVVSPIESLGYAITGTDSAKAAKYLPLFSKCEVVFKPIEEFTDLYLK